MSTTSKLSPVLPATVRQAVRSWCKASRFGLRQACRELGGVVLAEDREVDPEESLPEADHLALRLRRAFDQVDAIVRSLERSPPAAARREPEPPPDAARILDRKSLAAGERDDD